MRTWEAERSKIDRIVEAIGDNLINEMDETVFRRYRRNRLKSVTVSTVNRDFETIRAMFRKAKKKKWVREIPDFDDFIQKSLEKRRTVTITDSQEKKIFHEARKLINTTAPRLYALILALRDSSARPNELYPVNDYSADKAKYEPLRWRDLLDEQGEIRDISRLVSYKGKVREDSTNEIKTSIGFTRGTERYRINVNAADVFPILQASDIASHMKCLNHAERVCLWAIRNLIESQITCVVIGALSFEEAFFQFLVTDDESLSTVFEKASARRA